MGRNSIGMMCNRCDINVNIVCLPCTHSTMSCQKRNACTACNGESFILNSTYSFNRIVNCQMSCDYMIVYVIRFMSCMASLLLHDACFGASLDVSHIGRSFGVDLSSSSQMPIQHLMPMQTKNSCTTNFCPSSMLASYMLKLSHEFSHPLQSATCRDSSIVWTPCLTLHVTR